MTNHFPKQTNDNNSPERYVVGIEIGSSQAKIGVAGFDPADPHSPLTIYNIASVPTVDSVRYGKIVNIREVHQNIDDLLLKIDKEYPLNGRVIINVYISIGGRSLKSRSLKSQIVLPQRCEITENVIKRLEYEAIDSLRTSDELICVLPVRYKVDNLVNPKPIGSLGTRVAGEFTAIVSNSSNQEDVQRVLEDLVGINIIGVTVRPLAMAPMLLTPKEMNAGCMLVDFGAETITVSIYRKKALQYLTTIPFGSRLITKDLANILSITEEEAELLKIQRGNVSKSNEDSAIVARMQQSINDIINARVADVIANIEAQPKFAGLSKGSLPGGIILTGGGSKLRNFARTLEDQADMKVRIATLPSNIVITDADLSTTDNLDIISLLNFAAEDFRMNPTKTCVSTSSTQIPQSVVKSSQEPTRSLKNEKIDVVIDFTTHEGEVVELEEEYNYSGSDLGVSGVFSDEEDFQDEISSGIYSSDEEDDLTLLDSDDAEKARAARARNKKKQEEKAQRKAEKDRARNEKKNERKTLAQIARVKELEDDVDVFEDDPEKTDTPSEGPIVQKGPSRIDRLLSKGAKIFLEITKGIDESEDME